MTVMMEQTLSFTGRAQGGDLCFPPAQIGSLALLCLRPFPVWRAHRKQYAYTYHRAQGVSLCYSEAFRMITANASPTSEPNGPGAGRFGRPAKHPIRCGGFLRHSASMWTPPSMPPICRRRDPTWPFCREPLWLVPASPTPKRTTISRLSRPPRPRGTRFFTYCRRWLSAQDGPLYRGEQMLYYKESEPIEDYSRRWGHLSARWN